MPTLVEIVPCNPKWVTDFAVAEVLLRAALGNCVVAVDHVGSTAVPDLASKPVIDIDITLSNLGRVPGASDALTKAEFDPRGNRYDDDVWAFLLRQPTLQIRAYICPLGNPTHERRMLFRNYLRQHEEVAIEYAALKRRLAAEFPYEGDRYTREKSAFVSKIVSRRKKICHNLWRIAAIAWRHRFPVSELFLPHVLLQCSLQLAVSIEAFDSTKNV